MVAQLKIDQAGLVPEGSPGVARTDGKADGSLVTLTNTGEGATTAFRLLWTPPGDVDAVGSLAATEEDPKVWTFSPTPARYGTYEVEMIENAGLTSEKRERRAFVVRTPYLGLVIPALNERGNKSSTLVATGDTDIVDNNSQDDPDPDLAALNFAGWWRQQHALIMAVDALFAPVRVTHYHADDGGAITRKAYASLGDAFEATYPTEFPSTAVHEIQPNPFSPLDAGPHTLNLVVAYVLRATAGRGSVSLPGLVLLSVATIERCTVAHPIESGTTLIMRECDVEAAGDVEADLLEVYDSTLEGPVKVTGTAALFDRCKVFGALTSDFDHEVNGGTLTLVNCTFGVSPQIEFTGATAGEVRMDPRTAYLFAAAGGNVTNGSIVVEAPP